MQGAPCVDPALECLPRSPDFTPASPPACGPGLGDTFPLTPEALLSAHL